MGGSSNVNERINDAASALNHRLGFESKAGFEISSYSITQNRYDFPESSW